jgi:hypothetical protein
LSLIPPALWYQIAAATAAAAAAAVPNDGANN